MLLKKYKPIADIEVSWLIPHLTLLYGSLVYSVLKYMYNYLAGYGASGLATLIGEGPDLTIPDRSNLGSAA